MNKRDQIKQDLIMRIRSGTLAPGEKLPSIRTLAKQYGVSMTPATDACSDLVEKGWLESRPCSGFYVSENVLNFGISDFRSRESRLASERYGMFSGFISRYSDIALNANNNIDFAFSSTAAHTSFYPCDEFLATISQALKQAPGDLNYYNMLHDSPDLKPEILRWMLPCKCSTSLDEISIVRSGSDALILALRACAAPGSTVAVESPGHVGFLFAAKYFDLDVLPVRSDPVTGLDIDEFERLLRSGKKPACLILTANFSNPTGALMPDSNKARLTKLCAAAQIPIIEDDVLGELYFTGSRPRPLKSFDNDNVIYISSFGKCLTPISRLGFVAPGKYADQLAFAKHLTISYVYPPLQKAVQDFLKSGAAYRHVNFLRSHLKRVMESYCDIIRSSFPKGTSVRMPEGGVFLWVTLPGNVDSSHFAEAAKTSGIGVAPAYFFQPQGMPVPNAFRLNCTALPWTQETRSALRQLGEIATRISLRQI